MSIVSVEIKNCKSIRDIQFSISEINCLIGENGAGKSNIIEVIEYFYNNLTKDNINNKFHDKTNPYNSFFQIAITYDLNKLSKIANNQNFIPKIKLEDGEYNIYSNNNPLFTRIRNLYSRYADENGLVRIVLKQYRDNIQEWNVPFELRTFVENYQPIYFVNSRSINLTNWEDLWNIISDLNKFSTRDNLDQNLGNIFSKITNDRHSPIIDYLKNILDETNLGVKEFKIKQKFAKICQLELGGEEFKHKDNNLDFFSDGVNAYNYLKILIRLVSKIEEKLLKETLVVIDEPEVGLHPQYIDELAESFIDKSDFINILMATHSSRMLKNIISKESNNKIFHVTHNNSYTKLTKMENINDDRGYNVISETEASFYFSSKILCVEGDTELELFSNKNILNLFPEFKKVDIFPKASDAVKLNLIHPNKRNINIPYLMVFDLDKVINCTDNELSFENNKVNLLTDNDVKNKEKLFYDNKRDKTYKKRIKLINLLDNCKIQFNKYWGYIIQNKEQFDKIKRLVKEFFLEYNMFINNTTIEGTLINRNSYSIFYNWLKKSKNENLVNSIFKYEPENCLYKLSVARSIFGGKCDNLHKISKAGADKCDLVKKESDDKIYNKIETLSSKKTSGWITNFLNYFFDNHINKINITNREKRKIFKFHFPELYQIINFLIEK